MLRRLARLHPWLRAACLTLLVLGTVVRPLLVVGCEIHAASFAHAAQPHVHDHPQAAGEERNDGHGVHELMQLDAQAGLVDPMPALDVPALGFARVPLPLPAVVPVRAAHVAAPFRPPIA
ncbi:MAG TPA: hypothetical protein VFO79_11990 [Xanthomonadales bacterium]|nr:hypothetical protein [Xanthomonadales bacterium]